MRTEEQKRKDNNLYVKLRMGVTDFLSHVLPVNGTPVLLFDLQRTVYYGKSWEYIPDRHYDKGIVATNSGTGERYPVVGVLGMSKATRKRYRKVLIDLGIERVEYMEGTGKRRVYVDVDRLLELIEEGKKQMLKLSKKYKKEQGLGGAQNEPRCAQNEPTISNYISKGTEKVKDLNKAKASPRVSTSSSADKAKEKHLKKRKQKVEKITVPTIKNVKLIWAEAISAYKEYNPTAIVVPPTQKDLMIFVKRTKEIFKNDSSWKNILYKAVSEWDTMIPHFKWVDRVRFEGGAPATPSLRFIRSFYTQIVEAQQSQRGIDAVNKANHEKRQSLQAADRKKLDSLESKIQKLEKKLGREKANNVHGHRKNEELTAKLSKANEDKDKYYRSLPTLTDEELQGMELPEYADLPQNNVH